MIYINITNFVLISSLEKDLSMIETRRLENVVIFFQTKLSFMEARKINSNPSYDIAIINYNFIIILIILQMPSIILFTRE